MKEHFLNLNQIKNLPRILAISVLLLGTTLTSCEQSCGEEPAPGDSNCSTEVTAQSAGCASGAFQNYWFKLDNGEWLQPFENISNFAGVEPGKRYRIGYETMRRDSRYDNLMICQALPPKGQAIRVFCITPLEEGPTGNCDTYVTARAVECSFGAWGNIWLQLEDGRYLQPWNNGTSTTQLTEGAKYKIGYSQMAKDSRYNNGVICAAMPSDQRAWNPEIVSVNCLEPVAGK